MKPWKLWTAGVAFLTLFFGCQSAPAENPTDAVRAVFSGTGAEWIDMTYVLDEDTIFWPTARPFELEVVSAGVTDAGYYYGANNFCTAEHGGTHLDAPIHFSAGKQTADQIPVDRLVGPAIVLDTSQAAAADPDYLIKVSDLEAWEAEHGAIPDGSILLLRTGWGAHWPDRGRYLGTTRTGEEAIPELHFPGLDPAAATWLVENRDIDAIGIDTASIDYGQSTLFETHRILLAENIPAFENISSLDRLPETGSYVVGLPMKIGQGTGSPLRLLGVLPGLGDARR